jgi:hypothetical protein
MEFQKCFYQIRKILESVEIQDIGVLFRSLSFQTLLEGFQATQVYISIIEGVSKGLKLETVKGLLNFNLLVFSEGGMAG